MSKPAVFTPPAKTPIAVLTGFLGSGKTSFLGKVLAAPEMAGTAVIINEAGEMSLDHLLVKQVAEQTYELPSGCLCCIRRLDIVTTVRDLIEARDAGLLKSFDRIVIETSGLADPAPILYTLAADPMLGHVLDFHAIVTVVDAVAGEATLARYPESVSQIAVADRILVSKTDLSPLSPALSSKLDALNEWAPRLDLQDEVRPGDLLFGERPIGIGSKPSLRLTTGRSDAAVTAQHGFGVRTLSLTFDAQPSRLDFAMALGRFATERGEDLLRVKGLMVFADRPDAVAIIHAVQHTIYRPQWLTEWPDADSRSRLVFIARDIDDSEILERFAFARPARYLPLAEGFVCEPVFPSSSPLLLPIEG